MAERVRITEVGPRDGLQNEPGIIPTAEKVRLVELCCATGVDEVEVTSFVSPKWVPQLGDSKDVVLQLWHDVQGNGLQHPTLSALVPNKVGMWGIVELDANHGVRCLDKVAVFTAASETFSRKNTNVSIAESIERFVPVVEMAHDSRHPRRVRGYISCVIACPFEGPIQPDQVLRVIDLLTEVGVDEIDLGDTIGAGTPESVERLLRAASKHVGSDWWGSEHMTLHLHDTFGRAAECVTAALACGVRSFDGSVAGLGGCPYASTPGKRAPGNISTETLVRTVHAAGFETGVDLDKLSAAAEYAREIVGQSRGGGG